MTLKCCFFVCIMCSATVVTFFFIFYFDSKKYDKLSELDYIRTFRYENVKVPKNSTVSRYLQTVKCKTNFIVWIVSSYAGDPVPRSALRRAYTNDELEKLNIQRVFLLGLLDETAKNKTHISQQALINEGNRFGDIIQGEFIDSYKNLTSKHLMGLRWVLNNCKNVQYVIKMDDDIIVNLFEMINLLKSNQLSNEDVITGYVMKNMKPIRNSASKWFVEFNEYNSDIYPDFVSGWLYVTNLKVVNQLLSFYDENRIFWIDDVFITGMLRNNTNIKLNDIQQLFTTDYRYLECCINDMKKFLKCDFIIGPDGGDSTLQVRFRNFAELCHTQCTKRPKNLSVNNTCIAIYEPKMLNISKAQARLVRIF